MKKINLLNTLIVASILFFSCKEEEVIIEKEAIQEVSSSSARSEVSQSSFDVNYSFTKSNGDRRTVSDRILYRLRKPDGNRNDNPLIITMGGGNFTGLGKEGIVPYGDLKGLPFLTEKQLDDNEIAYMQISYYLVGTGRDGVYRSLYSAEAAVKYVIDNASSFGIDPDRIIVLGHSAGASTSLWLGLTRDGGVAENIKGIVAIDAQSSLDFTKWKRTFNSYGKLSLYYDGIGKIKDMKVKVNGTKLSYLKAFYYEHGGRIHSPKINKIVNAHDLDFLSKMDANDAEIYLMNTSEENDAIHSVVHSMKIRDVSNSMNRPITIGDVKTPRIQAEERIIDFCKRKFGI